MERNRMTPAELAAVNFVVPNLPKVVRIEPASSCNLRCIHCPTGINKPVKGERGVMSKETFEIVMDRLRSNIPDVVVLYQGGEPFLNRRFVDMVRRVKSLGVPFVKTVSNGMLLTEENMRGIINAKLDVIEFSLDGNDPAENNAIRLGADYYKIVENIKRLLDLTKELGSATPKVFISNTQMFDSTSHGPGATPPTPQFLLDEFDGAYAGRVAFKEIYMQFWPGLEPEDFDRAEAPIATSSEKVNHCDQLVNTIHIRWNGDVVPCCYDITSKYVIDNIKDKSLEEIWNNPLYLQIRESIYTGNYMPLCQNCPVVRPNLRLAFKKA